MSHSFVIYLCIICGNLSGDTFPACSYTNLSEIQTQQWKQKNEKANVMEGIC